MRASYFLLAGWRGFVIISGLLFCPCLLNAQIYSIRSPISMPSTRLEKPASKTMADRLFSVYAGPAVAVQPLKDNEGETVSYMFAGAAAGVQGCISSRVCLALEGQQLFPNSSAQGRTVRQRGVSGSVLFNITPDVTPVLWLEAGMGNRETYSRFSKSNKEAEHFSSAVYWIGGKSSVDLGHSWAAGYFWRLVYQTHKDLGFILRYASHTSMQGAVFLVKSF